MDMLDRITNSMSLTNYNKLKKELNKIKPEYLADPTYTLNGKGKLIGECIL